MSKDTGDQDPNPPIVEAIFERVMPDVIRNLTEVTADVNAPLGERRAACRALLKYYLRGQDLEIFNVKD